MKVYLKGEDQEEETKNSKCKCKVCNREFNSIKALYGHMRSHPDRSWKGIQPPISVSVLSSSLPLPSSWSLTARRGCKGISSDDVSATVVVVAPSSSSSWSSSSEVLEANPVLVDVVDKRRKVKKMKKMNEIELKKLYKCDSCEKEFLCHQALGGHKSRHYKTKILLPNSDLTRPRHERTIRDFDLNELPPMEDDDDNDNGEAKQV